MKCVLCQEDIVDYDAAFHHMRIDDTRSADLCLSCIDTFAKWYAARMSILFPTKNLKKRYAEVGKRPLNQA